MTKIAAIARNAKDSPNMTSNDAAILQSITAELAAHGAEVVLIGKKVMATIGYDNIVDVLLSLQDPNT